jgi:hypothetical protein
MTSTSPPKGKEDHGSKSKDSAFNRILTTSMDSTTFAPDPAYLANLSLLVCVNYSCVGGDVTATSLFVPDHPLVREFFCNLCGVSFVACFQCQAQLKTIATVRQHLRLKHAVTDIPPPEDEEVTGGHEVVEDPVDTEADQRDVLLPSQSLLQDQFPHCPPESQRFFHSNQLPDGGSKYLAGLACCELEALEVSDLDPLEVKMVAQTAQLVSQLSRRNRTLLASLSKSIVDVVKRQRSESLELEANPEKERRPFAISPITDPALLRSTFIKGKCAYLPNLPRPQARDCVAHSYCLPSECVQNSLAFGHDLDEVAAPASPLAPTLYPLAKLALTPSCRKLFDINQTAGAGRDNDICDVPVRDIHIDLWMSEWSDDFEPNDSIKGNRGSVWIKTLTVAPDPDSRHKHQHTYPIAIGHKSADHEEVERLLKEDFLKLGTLDGIVMYSKKYQGLVRVRAKILVSLMDQPERRGANCLMGGGSTYHGRFGYSAPWAKFLDVLPPCDSCRAKLFDFSTDWSVPDCDDCTNWAYYPDHPLLRFEPPEDLYLPWATTEGEMEQQILSHEDEFLAPTQLTYPGLILAVTITHEAIVSGQWSNDNARAYLKLFCISTKAILEILQHADNCKMLHDISNDPDASALEKSAVLEESEADPVAYSPWPIPALWSRGTDLAQHPDIPMHLLFLGVVKTTVLMAQRWLKNKGKSPAFIKETAKLLEWVEDLKLSWCKVIPYRGGKLGGWVSENYLALSRLLRWVYSRLDELAVDREPFVEPDLPLDRWTVKPLNEWLRIRGLSQSGLKDDKYKRVKGHLEGPGPTPPIMAETAGPVSVVLATIEALDDMIALLMVESIDDSSYYSSLERMIRVFLTHFADMDAKLQRPVSKKTKKRSLVPSWVSSYNFLSLLNLPDIVREYGPIRLIWEGGTPGEGFLRTAKPCIPFGLRKGWEMSTMTKLLKGKALETILSSSDMGNDIPPRQERQWFVYPTVAAISNLLVLAEKPISAVRLGNGLFGVVAKFMESPKFIGIETIAVHTEILGLSYYEWRAIVLDHDAEYQPFVEESVDGHMLLLPLLQNIAPGHVNYQQGIFAAVFSNHTTLAPTDDYSSSSVSS